MKKFETSYEDDLICVTNSVRGEQLIVNNELQDEQNGLFATRSRLFGRTSSGKRIKVSLGGTLTIHCKIFIDDKLVFSK